MRRRRFRQRFPLWLAVHRDGGSPPQQAGKHAVATLVLGTLTNVYVVLWSVSAVNRADFSNRSTGANLGSFLQALNAMAWAATAGLLLLGISYRAFCRGPRWRWAWRWQSVLVLQQLEQSDEAPLESISR